VQLVLYTLFSGKCVLAPKTAYNVVVPVERQKMWKKQRWAYRFALDRGRKGTGLFMGCGTGKSRVSIHALEEWMAEADVKLVLIVNILTGLHVWIEQWNRWATYPVTFIDLHEAGPAGLRKARALASNGYPVICLINFESTWQLGHRRREHIRDGKPVKLLDQVDTALHDIEWDAVLVDESNGIASPSARATKYLLKKLKPQARYRMVLTGSAYTKRPLDVYTQLRFALKETEFLRLFPPTHTKFKQRYAVPHPYIRGATLGYQNLEDLVERMSTCCVMLRKEDVLDLPPVVHEDRRIILPEKVQKIYDEVTDELYSELEGYEANGGTVTVNHVFAIMRKQAQITSGFIKMDPTEEKPDGEILELGTWKIDDVLQILHTRAGEPTLIVTQADYEEVMLAREIRREFKFKPKILNGSVVGAEARHKLTKAAAEDPCYIVKEAVAARSIDIQWANMTIFYSHSPNTVNYEQILSRNHRGEQKMKITYMHLYCKGTVDQRLMKILERDLDVKREIEAHWRKLIR
jgi:hypothetical protein